MLKGQVHCKIYSGILDTDDLINGIGVARKDDSRVIKAAAVDNNELDVGIVLLADTFQREGEAVSRIKQDYDDADAQSTRPARPSAKALCDAERRSEFMK